MKKKVLAALENQQPGGRQGALGYREMSASKAEATRV